MERPLSLGIWRASGATKTVALRTPASELTLMFSGVALAMLTADTPHVSLHAAPSGPTRHSQQQHHIKSSRTRACKCDARQTEPVAWCVVGGRRGEGGAHLFIGENGRKEGQTKPAKKAA